MPQPYRTTQGIQNHTPQFNDVSFSIRLWLVQIFEPLNHYIWYEYKFLNPDIVKVQIFELSAQKHTPQLMVYPLVHPAFLSMKSITYNYFKLISLFVDFWHRICNNNILNGYRSLKIRAFLSIATFQICFLKGDKMETTENGKKEITYFANESASEKIPNTKRLTTNIGANRGADEKYEIYFLIPASDEESKERYDCNLADLVEMGVRQIATRIDYPSVMFDEDGDLKDGGHEAGQELADGYKVGAKRIAGATQKKKAAELDNLQKSAEDVDMNDPEALAAFVARVKKSGATV